MFSKIIDCNVYIYVLHFQFCEYNKELKNSLLPYVTVVTQMDRGAYDLHCGLHMITQLGTIKNKTALKKGN